MNLSPHFTLAEAIKSQTAERRGIDNMPGPEIVEKLEFVSHTILEPVRLHFGIPFSPSSWYRCRLLCLAIGSSVDSQHAKGEASDFEVPGIPNPDLADYIIANLPFDQLILEYFTGEPDSGWVHCSAIPNGGRRQALVYDGKNYTPY